MQITAIRNAIAGDTGTRGGASDNADEKNNTGYRSEPPGQSD
jgi:hypothetical protein